VFDRYCCDEEYKEDEMGGAMYHVCDKQLSKILEETKQSRRPRIRWQDNIKISARK